jgi:hypothetical protein
MKGDVLVDRAAIQEVLDRSHVGATVRGIEGVLEGKLLAADTGYGKSTPREWRLRTRAPGPVVQLAPLVPEHIVQWDRARNRRMPPTAAEMAAYQHLYSGSGHPNVGDWVRIVGPLGAAPRGEGAGVLPVLEVRYWERSKIEP